MAFVKGERCVLCGKEIRPGEDVYQEPNWNAKPGEVGYVAAHMRCPEDFMIAAMRRK